ncbi:MAG: hypothetical protein EBZ47_04405 [Chlamydiae bacterium]|nr:hypothetical protein [Chlamydiota bacterium]
MKLRVESDIVRENVELFKLLLKRSLTKNKNQLDNKVYLMFVHKITGKMTFFADFEDLPHHQWQPISLKLKATKGPKGALEWEVCDSGNDPSVNGLNDTASAVFRQTFKTIQVISRLLPRIQDVSKLLDTFSQVQLIQPFDKPVFSDIIHESWHQIPREQAENVLSTKESGTFFFRKDEYAKILEVELSKAHKRMLPCITLTYIDSEARICDKTLVYVTEGWMVYDDDPRLLEPIYPDIETFLDNMKGILKAPLIHGADF